MSFGAVGAWNSRDKKVLGAWLQSVTLELRLPDGSFGYLDSIHGIAAPNGGSLQDFFDGVDDWFYNLLTWVGVAVDQDTAHDSPLSSATAAGQGLTVRAIEADGQVSSLASSTVASVNLRNSELLNLTVLRRLIKLVGNGVMPHDSHLLLRDAWIEHRRDRWRRAVIDAGTATELVLAAWNVAHNNNAQPNGGYPTLGWLVRQANGLTPSNSITDLVNVRNDAVHKNIMPTRLSASTALDVAHSIVTSLAPLPF